MRHRIQMKTVGQATPPPSREHDGFVGDQDDQPELEDILNSIVVTCGDPARVLELFYWSQEPEVLEVIRWLMALSGKAREALCSFLTSVPDPQLVSVEVSLQGHVTLSSPEIAESMSAMPRPAARTG